MMQDYPTNSLVEDDAISEASVADISRFIPRMPPSPCVPHVISIGQLLESVTSIMTSIYIYANDETRLINLLNFYKIICPREK